MQYSNDDKIKILYDNEVNGLIALKNAVGCTEVPDLRELDYTPTNTNTVFVDSVNGNDGWNGNEALPKLTLQAGLNILTSTKNRIMLCGGEYELKSQNLPVHLIGIYSKLGTVSKIKPLEDFVDGFYFHQLNPNKSNINVTSGFFSNNMVQLSNERIMCYWNNTDSGNEWITRMRFFNNSMEPVSSEITLDFGEEHFKIPSIHNSSNSVKNNVLVFKDFFIISGAVTLPATNARRAAVVAYTNFGVKIWEKFFPQSFTTPPATFTTIHDIGGGKILCVKPKAYIKLDDYTKHYTVIDIYTGETDITGFYDIPQPAEKVAEPNITYANPMSIKLPDNGCILIIPTKLCSTQTYTTVLDHFIYFFKIDATGQIVSSSKIYATRYPPNTLPYCNASEGGIAARLEGNNLILDYLVNSYAASYWRASYISRKTVNISTWAIIEGYITSPGVAFGSAFADMYNERMDVEQLWDGNLVLYTRGQFHVLRSNYTANTKYDVLHSINIANIDGTGNACQGFLDKHKSRFITRYRVSSAATMKGGFISGFLKNWLVFGNTNLHLNGIEFDCSAVKGWSKFLNLNLVTTKFSMKWCKLNRLNNLGYNDYNLHPLSWSNFSCAEVEVKNSVVDAEEGFLVTGNNVSIKDNHFMNAGRSYGVKINGSGSGITISNNDFLFNYIGLYLQNNNGSEVLKNSVFFKNAISIKADVVNTITHSVVFDLIENIILGTAALVTNPLYYNDGAIDITKQNLNLKSKELGHSVNSPAIGLSDDGRNAGAIDAEVDGIDSTWEEIIISKGKNIAIEFSPVEEYENQLSDGSIDSGAGAFSETVTLTFEGMRNIDFDKMRKLYFCTKSVVRIYFDPISKPNDYLLYDKVFSPIKASPHMYKLSRAGVHDISITFKRAVVE
jgi:hypothetical protein